MTWLLVLGIFVLVAVNGFFVAAEFALVRSRRSRIEELAAGTKGAQRALAELDELSEYLSACQLGITLASIGIGFLGEPAVADIVEPLFPDSVSHGLALAISLVLSFALTTALHITIGEQVPKIMAITRAEATAIRIARPLHFFARAFGPPVRALNAVSNSILRLMGIDPEAEFSEGGSPQELRRLLAESAAGGLLPVGQAEMIGGVFDLEEQQARHVMTPAPNVTRIALSATVAETARTCVESGHTRLVVVDPDRGVHGVVHASRVLGLLLSDGSDAPVKNLVVDPLVVPETRALPDLLRGLRAAHVALAVVVDEYGRMAGVVTMEDVLEEIVGEIADETDASELPVRRISEGEWLAQGEVSLADLVSHGIELESQSDAIMSLGGLVLHLAGRLPEAGEAFRADGYELEVVGIEGTRVAEVRVRRLAGSPAAGSGRTRPG
jgi:CBS domain containing-hemolysin-like protein